MEAEIFEIGRETLTDSWQKAAASVTPDSGYPVHPVSAPVSSKFRQSYAAYDILDILDSYNVKAHFCVERGPMQKRR